jgi:hypothetical protein
MMPYIYFLNKYKDNYINKYNYKINNEISLLGCWCI